MSEPKTLFLRGNVSSLNDINDIFKELCTFYREDLFAMRAITRSTNDITCISLLLFCRHKKIKLEVDYEKDEVTVYYKERKKGPRFIETIERAVPEEPSEPIIEEDPEDIF